MKTWQDEVKQAVEAGEHEFGPLDGHQMPKHNLVHRCEEILAEHMRLGLEPVADGDRRMATAGRSLARCERRRQN